MKRTVSAIALAAFALGSTFASAETLRWARAGDSITLDPHGQNEGPTHTLAHQIYEPLLQRDMSGEIIPTLATEWAALDDNPNVWRFKLREGVKFHGGQDLTADDVVFSFKRAMMPSSAMKELLASVVDVRKVDDYTVDFETDGPNPLLPNNMTNLFVVDEGWTTENGGEAPQDVAAGEENYLTRNANGTGAYTLVSRAPDEKTVLQANPDYWGIGEFPLEVTEIIYTPIQNQATRVAALLSGDVDFIQDVPVQDLARVDGEDGLKVVKAPQNRTIFFGMDTAIENLRSAEAEGNPLSDVRVRNAMNMAISRDAIQRIVMRGQSDPTGIIIPPFVNGWTEELGAAPAYDVREAKKLMEEAGYADGFTVQLDCPNDRYINDEAICQAAVGMLGRIGVKVNLNAQPKAQHFPLIQNGETDFYMLGWGVPPFDSEYVFNFLTHTKGDKYGSWNATGYSNPELDEMIQGLASEVDLDARNEMIAKIWAEIQAQTIYLPIHNQILNWGMKDGIDFDVQPEDQPHFKFLTYVK